MSSIFEEAAKYANACLEVWPSVISFLQTAESPGGERFNQEQSIPGTDVELWWFDERVISVCGLISGLGDLESDQGALVPLDVPTNMQNAAKNALESASTIQVYAQQSSENGIETLNPDNWTITIKGTNEKVNIASHLQNLKKPLENLLRHYLSIAAAVKDSNFNGFSDAIRDFSDFSETIRKNSSESQIKLNTITSHLNQIVKLTESASVEKKSISDYLKSATDLLEQSEKITSKTENIQTRIENINQSAAQLKEQIDQYNTQFDSFQKQLDGRNNSFDKLFSQVNSLYESLKNRSDQIGETINQAENMLVGATNAGLSGTFKTNLDKLDTQLSSAQEEFYRAILFVFCSALPLTIYVIATTVMTIFPASAQNPPNEAHTGFWENLAITVQNDGITLSATLALFLIMVPSIWRAKFSAAKYHQIFQLREHYQYKYSLAMAVDGFKKQAPEHADAIAAETFARLLFNPADRLSGSEPVDSHPSPLMNWLMNKFGFNAKGEQK